MAARLEFSLQAITYKTVQLWGLDKNIILQVLNGDASTIAPQWRYYKVGDPPPAWSNLNPLFGTYLGQSDGIFGPILTEGAGTYVIEYKDSARPDGVILGQILLEDYATGCFDETWINSKSTYINAGPSGLTIVSYVYAVTSGAGYPPPVNFDSLINRKVSIDGGTTWFAMTQVAPGVFNNQSLTKTFTWEEVEALSFENIPSIKIRRESTVCVTTVAEDFLTTNITPFTLSESHTNCTAFDVDDGTINISIADGSGDFTVLWDDDVTTSLSRTGLAPGVYHITVTDNLTEQEEELFIQIIEPAFVAPPAPVFEFPVLNPVHFVVNPVTPDGDEVLQTLDNVLLCDQYHPGFLDTNYFQPITKKYITPFQFNSNYNNHTAQLFNYLTDELVKTFAVVLKEQLVGTQIDYAVTLRAHIGFPNQTRVYFNVGIPPLPLVVNEVIEILNSSNGVDNLYNIVSINLDSTLGYQYLVINVPYVGPITSSATGRFDSSLEDFNVYEVAMDFQDVADGKYYVKVVAFNDDANDNEIAESEPIDLKVAHTDTTLISYRNNDNGYGDISWTTGILCYIRIPSVLYKRLTGGERSTSRDADYSLVKINAKKTRGMLLEVYMLPPYLHEKLSLIFDCDFFTINGVEMQASDAYEEPKYLDRFLLANSSIKLEQRRWFRNYNSDDIGTVNEEGFITTETGFLKR